ncbi:hypothetical protein ACWIGM_08120 [Bosea sp. NPDC055332]
MLLLPSLAVLGAFAMLAIATAALLCNRGGWSSADRPLALAVGVTCAPALAGVALLPFFLAGWHPINARALPFVLAGLMLILAGWPLPLRLPGVWRRPRLATLAIMVIVAGLLLALLALPLIENDALEYAAVARFLALEGNLQRYPLVMADPASGLYAPSIHPPLFHLALVWGQAWFGENIFMAQRLITLWSAVGATCVVGVMAGRESRLAAACAMLLLATTPFWLSSVAGYGIDAMRIALFTAAVASVLVVVEVANLRRATSVGLVSGLAMWTHGIGILAPAFAGISLALFLLPARQWRPLLAFGLVALLGGGGWLLRNLWLLGTAIGDDWPAANWPNLAFAADLAARRGLVTLPEQVIHGALRPWIDIGLFGPAFWLALLALPLGVRRPRGALTIALVVVFGFTALALLSVAAGSLLVVKNPRYVLTVAPFAAIAAGIGCARLLRAAPVLGRVAQGVLALALIWGAINLGIRSYGLADLGLVLSGQERGFLQKPRVTGGPLLEGLEGLEPGRVLSFRPPEVAIYGGHPWIDHTDPRLKELHSADVATAAAWLARHDVRFALLPDYSPVTHGRSSLGFLLGDPAWAEPLAAHRGARLFRLRETPAAIDCSPQPLAAAIERSTGVGLGDVLARLSGIPHLRRILPGGAPRIEPDTVFDWSSAGMEELEIAVRQPFEGRFAATLQLSGTGVFAVDAVIASETGASTEIRLIDALADPSPRTVSGQWFTGPGQTLRALRVKPLAPASGRVELHSASVCRVGER